MLPVRPADILSAPTDSAGCKRAGRTDCKSVFRKTRSGDLKSPNHKTAVSNRRSLAAQAKMPVLRRIKV
jgi:hypothetical protein